MKINVKDVNSCEKLLTIDVPSEMVTEEFSSFYESVGKKAKIPGFRPGHAPKHVVALHFRDEAKQEVWKQLVSRTFRDAIKQEEISVIGYPRIENVEFDETRLKFKAHVEMRPKIKIDKYVGLTVKRDPVQVNESEIEEAIKRIQQAHAKFQAVEGRESKLGDFLICDYRLLVDQKEIEKREGEWIELREKDYLEGFSKQLLGAKAGELREVTVTFPAEYGKKEIAGKKGQFSITVKEVKEKKLPALDDELAKEAGDYETFQDLRKAIAQDIDQHKKHEVEKVACDPSLDNPCSSDESSVRRSVDSVKGPLDQALVIFFCMYSTASPTVFSFSASSSGISALNSSSKAMTNSTVSRESAPRSSMKEASRVTSSAFTPSCSTIMSFTFCSMSTAILGLLCRTQYHIISCVLNHVPMVIAW